MLLFWVEWLVAAIFWMRAFWISVVVIVSLQFTIRSISFCSTCFICVLSSINEMFRCEFELFEEISQRYLGVMKKVLENHINRALPAGQKT